MIAKMWTVFGHFLASWTRSSAVTACLSLCTDVMSTTVRIQKEKNLSPERSRSDFTSDLQSALGWTKFRAGGQNILPSKRLKFSCCITITHLSFCEASENHWKVLNVFFLVWCYLMSKLICLQSRFVYHSGMFELLCHCLILSACHWRH